MKTTIHAYRFDTKNPNEKAAYDALRAKLTAQGLKCFETWGGGGSYWMPKIDGREIELETKYLFDNQWNTAPIDGYSNKGLRVFDWAQDYPINFGAHIKRGHYLAQTDEMREIRRNTHACGYCGKQEPAAKGNVFCPHCLDSEYLKESELYLTRMIAVDAKRDARTPLTDAERAHLLPLYRAAQLHGTTERGRARIANLRKELESDFKRRIANATTEHDGFVWLIDHGINTSNVIFYPYTGRFGFGWRQPCSAEFVSALLNVISEFSFPYDIKCADGRTLSGN